MNIYIATALTHVPRAHFSIYTEHIHSLAKHLTIEHNAEVKYALINSDPQLAYVPKEKKAIECYQLDRELVSKCSIVIAECTFPSIGLGIELQLAEIYKIPVILLYDGSSSYNATPVSYCNPDNSNHELQIGDGNISLMALGLPNRLASIKFEFGTTNYQELDSIVRLQRMTY